MTKGLIIIYSNLMTMKFFKSGKISKEEFEKVKGFYGCL